MSAWFTVYSPQSLKHVRPADVAAFLHGPKVDWYILAETFGIEDEAVVERAADALRVKRAPGKLGEWFEVRYRPGRPLLVYQWSAAKRVREELAEAEENFLGGRKGRGVTAVRKALSGVTEVAAVELGLIQLEDMGLVIAGQVAEYLADVSGGVILDTDDQWWAVRRGIPKRLFPLDVDGGTRRHAAWRTFENARKRGRKSLIISILCRSDRPITPRDIKGWFELTGLLPNMKVVPDADAFPEKGIEIRYKGGRRPITIYQMGAEGTRKYVEEILEELESDPPVVKPALRRRLLAAVQTIDIDISPEHVDELIWTGIDEVEAQIADDYDGVIYVPGEAFYVYDKMLKRILSVEK